MDKDTIDSYFYSLARVIEVIYEDEILSDTLQFICSLSTELTGAKGATIRVLEHGTFNLKVLASYGLSEAYLKSGAIDYGKSVTEIEHGNIIIINDFKRDRRVKDLKAAEKEGLKAVIGIPFTVNETTYSILRTYYTTKKVPNQVEMELLNSLGQLSSIAIQRAAVAMAMHSENDMPP